jgi:RNA polymerase sigma-70 factor (ECF subfamily)
MNRPRLPYQSLEGSTKTPSAQAADPVEAGLLAKAQGGNLFAFEEIVKRYQRKVYGTALRIVRRHDVADDVTQEAFIRAQRALPSFDLSRPFGPWIARITANLAVNHLRSPRAREEGLPEGYAEMPSRDAGPLSGVLDEEARRVLETALGALPLEQRSVFVLRVMEDLSYREISEALGLNLGTVMSRLARAREKLRLALGPYLGESARRAGAAEP